MPSLNIRNVPKNVFKLLHDSARHHNRSLNGEIVSILAFEADLAQRGLELVRTYPAPARCGADGSGRLEGSRPRAQRKRGDHNRR